MTSLPCEAWTNVCQVNEVVSKTCARFQCLLCDEVYSVNRWAMEGHYVPDLLPKMNGADVPNEPDELEVSSGVSSDEDGIEIHE
ncbi:hypothetical protein P9112_006164 [Eukaryota sp. TZLM1-RC]